MGDLRFRVAGIAERVQGGEGMKTTIDWNYPPPRAGLAGLWDKFVGPGATRSETVLQVGSAVIAAIAAPLYAYRAGVDWPTFSYALCAALAFDIAGGVLTNATSSAKRWYHRQGQGFTHHLGFVAVHLLHLLLVSWVYLAFDGLWFLIAGGYLLLAATGILLAPQYLQRPLALLGYAGGLLIALYGLPQPIGLEWFLPLFYLKLLLSHLLKEEPYRPVSGVDARRFDQQT